jgi:hypothetical protein
MASLNLSKILTPHVGVDVLERFLRQGWVTCETVDLTTVLPAMRKPWPYLEGSEKHQKLMLIAIAYIEATGRTALIRGKYGGGGFCDVYAQDGSLFVECGDITSGGGRTILGAMVAQQTVMVIPYGQHENLSGYVFKVTDRWPSGMWSSIDGFYNEIHAFLAVAETDKEERLAQLVKIAAHRADFVFRTRNAALLRAMTCACRCTCRYSDDTARQIADLVAVSKYCT